MRTLTAADFRKVIRAVRKMTPAEIHISMVNAGILTKSGKLSRRYQREIW